jgi:membrane dipeptidase
MKNVYGVYKMTKKNILELNKEEEKRAIKIYKNAIVIDALTYAPTLPNFDKVEYLDELFENGITTNFTIHEPFEDLDDILNQISLWTKMSKKTGTIIVKSAEDIINAKKQKSKCIIFGIQNAKPLGENTNLVLIFHMLGIRIIQIAYNEQNLFGSGGDDKDSGITNLGRKVIEEMNRIGILIDVSHCGYRTTMDAINLSSKPIAFTHANPKVLCKHHRNKTDEELKALADRGGIVGLNAYSLFYKRHKRSIPDLNDFLDCLDYTVNLIGAKHVGFGLDLSPVSKWNPEGYADWARRNPGLAPDNLDQISLIGLDEPSKAINIARGLVKRGYTDNEIKGILGGNFFRLFESVF